jgi:hypothetical protein
LGRGSRLPRSIFVFPFAAAARRSSLIRIRVPRLLVHLIQETAEERITRAIAGPLPSRQAVNPLMRAVFVDRNHRSDLQIISISKQFRRDSDLADMPFGRLSAS